MSVDKRKREVELFNEFFESFKDWISDEDMDSELDDNKMDAGIRKSMGEETIIVSKDVSNALKKRYPNVSARAMVDSFLNAIVRGDIVLDGGPIPIVAEKCTIVGDHPKTELDIISFDYADRRRCYSVECKSHIEGGIELPNDLSALPNFDLENLIEDIQKCQAGLANELLRRFDVLETQDKVRRGY